MAEESKEITRDLFLELFRRYCDLENMCSELSHTYGNFMLLYLIGMLVTNVTNIYFAIYVMLGKNAGYHPVEPFVIVPIYFVWLWFICDVGEDLRIHVSKEIPNLIRFSWAQEV